jgi:hypothetical protein
MIHTWRTVQLLLIIPSSLACWLEYGSSVSNGGSTTSGGSGTSDYNRVTSTMTLHSTWLTWCIEALLRQCWSCLDILAKGLAVSSQRWTVVLHKRHLLQWSTQGASLCCMCYFALRPVASYWLPVCMNKRQCVCSIQHSCVSSVCIQSTHRTRIKQHVYYQYRALISN